MKHIMKFSTTTQYQEWKAANSGLSPYFCCCVDTGAKYYQELINNNGHDYVDLGLPSGTLWATMNIGASSPTGFGSYFAWGETSTKSSYTWNNYALGTEDNLTKYNATDGKTRLELSDDAAHVLWGGDWHIPTIDQWRELCSWAMENECYDYGNTIVFHGTGEVSLSIGRGGWMDDSSVSFESFIDSTSSDLNPNNLTQIMSFQDSGEGWYIGGSLSRYMGRPIRPVIGGEDYVFIDPDSGSIVAK